MANIVNNYGSTIVTIFQDVIRTYEMNIDIIKQCEDELNDLMHECELAQPKDMYRGWLLYKEIRDLRIKRRTAKNENQLMKDMYDYLKSQQGQQFKHKIQQIQGDSTKIHAIQETRTYTPRLRSDLTIAGKTCETNEPFEALLKEFNKTKVTMKNGKLRK